MFLKEDSYYKVKGSLMLILLELVNLYKNKESIDAERRDFLIGVLASECWYMNWEEL